MLASYFYSYYDMGVNPLWSAERIQAYTEVAIIVCARAKEEPLTERGIIRQLGQEALEYVQQLPHGPDETFRDTLFDDLGRDEIIEFDWQKRHYSLGLTGSMLVTNFLEELAENS